MRISRARQGARIRPAVGGHDRIIICPDPVGVVRIPDEKSLFPWHPFQDSREFAP
jgi:hypothetical protein